MISTIKNITFSCVHCSDSGWISGIHKVSKNQYAFRCGMCKAPEYKGLSLSIPMWTSAYKTHYENYIEYQRREGWKDVKSV